VSWRGDDEVAIKVIIELQRTELIADMAYCQSL
jgi:hypothetical protein